MLAQFCLHEIFNFLILVGSDKFSEAEFAFVFRSRFDSGIKNVLCMEFGAVGCARRCFSKERHFQSNKVVRSHYQQLLHRSEFPSLLGSANFIRVSGLASLNFMVSRIPDQMLSLLLNFSLSQLDWGRKQAIPQQVLLLNVQNFRHVNLMAPKVNTKLNYLAIFIPLQLVAPLNRINNLLEMLSVSLCSNTRRVFGEFWII